MCWQHVMMRIMPPLCSYWNTVLLLLCNIPLSQNCPRVFHDLTGVYHRSEKLSPLWVNSSLHWRCLLFNIIAESGFLVQVLWVEVCMKTIYTTPCSYTRIGDLVVIICGILLMFFKLFLLNGRVYSNTYPVPYIMAINSDPLASWTKYIRSSFTDA